LLQVGKWKEWLQKDGKLLYISANISPEFGNYFKVAETPRNAIITLPLSAIPK